MPDLGISEIAALIGAVASVATGTISTVNAANAQKAQQAAAEAAAKNRQLDASQQAAANANANLDQQVSTSQTNNVSLADQIKAKVAAQQGQAPGMSDSFWSGDTSSQYPGFAGLVSDVTGQNQNPSTTTA